MKKIEAVIKPYKLDDVHEALRDVISGMSVSEVRGFGRQRGHSEIYRGSEYKLDFVPKIILEFFCKDEDVETIVTRLQEHGRTGKIGDGKVFISSVDNALRIRTGERGEEIL